MDERVQLFTNASAKKPSKSYADVGFEKSISLYAIYLTNINRDFDIIQNVLCNQI